MEMVIAGTALVDVFPVPLDDCNLRLVVVVEVVSNVTMSSHLTRFEIVGSFR